MKRSQAFNDLLVESLKDPQEAIAYLNAVLEDCKDGGQESQAVLLFAFKNVIEAQGGITQLAKKSGLGRESLYKTLSHKGNPKLSTLTTLINAMGFDLKICIPSKR
ncbi:putative addiction module antidote protein [candidate division TM6 bacterium RIFCSPHIGHO2_12_FULL_36_22]|nr:MAG: putative addiction module antidote protein [candidate division TM6 bacterium RIFCSPHIGHO2_12_FULL_36_22]